MNTLTKGFAKRVISALLATIMVFSLGIVGLTSVSAANTELAETGLNSTWGSMDCVVYFDNSVSNWSGVQLLIGRDYNYGNDGVGSKSFTMTQISNTNIWYCDIDFNYANTFLFFESSSSWDWSGTGITAQYDYLNSASIKHTVMYDLTGDQTLQMNQFFKPKSNATETEFDYTFYGSTDDMNKINEKVYAKVVSSGTASNSSVGGTVKVAGYYLSDIGATTACSATTTLNSTYTANINVVRSSKVTLTATPATGYNFVGWTTSSSATTSSNTSKTITYYSSNSSTTYYALFEKAVSITNHTATINTESVVLGNSADITVGYTLSGTSNTPTLTLCDANGTAIGSGTADVTVNGKVITVTPKVASDYTFKVKITVDGVSTFTNTVTLNCKKEYSASLSVDNDTKYTDDTFTFTIDDNSDLYEGVKYEVFCDDTVTDIAVTDNTFTVSHATAGTYTYHVVATVDGEEVYTDKVEITVKARVFSVYLEAPKSTMEDRPFEIKATTEFAAGDVTYTLTGTDGTYITNTTGIFSVTVNTVGEYTFTVTASDGVNTDATATANVTITQDLGTYPVKIFFKCSDTYGYLPNAKVDGTAVELTKDSTIITYNATDTATYSWYSYTSGAEVEFGTEIVFSVNANRNYFYNASFTVSAGEGDFVQGEDGYYYYYLALENLNGGTSVLSNISKLTEAERNWTESAVNMIYDAADAKAPVGLNFAYANMNDANTDGKVNIKDATYIQKSLANVVEASALSTAVSDVNNDGKVTIKDATALQKQLANL